MSGQKRTALLISGGVNKTINYPRYRNDLARWCLALQARGFDCAVCFADGSGLVVAGARVRPAKRSDIEVELALLASLTSDDLVVVVVSNHGSATGFCTWGTDLVTPADLSKALGGCAATKVLILGQCYSGIFSSMAISDAVVITACGGHEPSWACAAPPGAGAYDEFLFHLSEALFGPVANTTVSNPSAPGAATPKPPNPAPTVVPVPLAAPISPSTLRTAFDQAVAQDRQPETPTISDATGLAKTLVLG